MTIPFRRLLSSALILIGCCLILWLSSIEELQAGAGQRTRSWVAGYLDDRHQFAQIAWLRLDELAGVRLWLPRPVTPGAGTVSVHIRSLEDRADLATARLAVAELEPHSATTFRFDAVRPPRLSGTQPAPVLIALETEGVDRSSAISVIAGPNRYSNGLLVRGEHPIPSADLAFEPLYRSRLFDRILPITQLARSRPSILGWPPLYALLIWIGLWGYAELLLRVAHSAGKSGGPTAKQRMD